ncbi:MAG: YcaO-related McrA-glycine thioamidation protein [Methanomicrobiales archaeon]|jgi:ribosomal protein S12 methylthiotransferase accessory factor|nr:YcaO-related McrA-glycine thioamidation protein [Methanomicrobiales archaeon]
MELSPTKKRYKGETHRTKSPEETFECICDLVSTAGITRVADITGLDRVGIPVFSCIRPEAAHGAISVYNGKGATEIAARVSGIMEGIERYSAEIHPGDSIIYDSYASLASKRSVLDPTHLILPKGTDANALYPWFEVENLTTRTSLLVPAHAIFHPVGFEYIPLFRTSTNGIASGNTYEEAVFHGLCEIIERDAWSLAEASNKGGPLITDITDPLILGMLDRFREAGIEIYLRDISSDIRVPTIVAIADDVTTKDPTLITIGMGTHSSPEIAAIRAITEVAQSRATQIHGAREDTDEMQKKRIIGYDRMKRINKRWFATNEMIAFSDIYCFESDDFSLDISYVMQELSQAGLNQILIANLTRSELDIPVVRVIVPGLEHYAIDSERSGTRCAHARHRYLPGSKPATM